MALIVLSYNTLLSQTSLNNSNQPNSKVVAFSLLCSNAINKNSSPLNEGDSFVFYFKNRILLGYAVIRYIDGGKDTLVLKVSKLDSSLCNQLGNKKRIKLKQVHTYLHGDFPRKIKQYKINPVELDLIPSESNQIDQYGSFLKPIILRVIQQVVLGNNRYDNQTLPSSFARTDVDLSINKGFIPLTFNLSYASDMNPSNNKLYHYSLNFDYEKLKENIIRQPNAGQYSIKQHDSLKDLEKLKLQKNIIKIKVDSIYKSLNNVEYKNRLNRDSINILDKVDTTELSYAEKLSFQRLKKHKQQLEYLRQIENEQLIIDKKISRLNLKRFFINDEAELQPKRVNDRLGKKLFLFNTVRRINVGVINPCFSELTLCNSNLRGVNIEINLIKFISLEFVKGTSSDRYTLEHPYDNSITLNGYKISLGRTKTNVVSINLVNTQFKGAMLDYDTKNGWGSSVSAKFTPLKSTSIYGEYAFFTPNNNQYYSKLLGDYSKNFSQQNSAYLFGFNTQIFSKINLDGKLRVTNQGFKSTSVPNLRRDHLMFYLKMNFTLLSKHRVSIAYGYDANNVSNKDVSTSSIQKINLTHSAKVSKTFTISTNYLLLKSNIYTESNLPGYIVLFSNQLSSTFAAYYKYKNIYTVVNSLIIGGNYGKGQFGDISLLKYLSNYTTITLLKSRISFNGETNLSSLGREGKIYNNSFGLNLFKDDLKGVSRVGLGLRILSTPYNRRDVFSASYSHLFKYNLKIDVKCDVHKVILKTVILNSNSYAYSISIKVQKTF